VSEQFTANWTEHRTNNILVEAAGDVVIEIRISQGNWSRTDDIFFGAMHPNDVTRVAAPPLSWSPVTTIEYYEGMDVTEIVQTAISNAGTSSIPVATGDIHYSVVSGTSIFQSNAMWLVESVGETTMRATKPGGSLYANDAFIDVTFEIVCAPDHFPGEEIIALEPTCLEEGRWEIYCTVCEELVEYGAIDALGHDLSDYILCPDDDTMWYKECSRCDYVPFSKRPVADVLDDRAPEIKSFGLTTRELPLVGRTLTLELDRLDPIILSTRANNRNIEGEYYLGGGYILRFDIKGNGSNIKLFEIVRLPGHAE
jgi:hypothetical protein